MNNANWTLYEDQVLLNVASLPNIEDNNEKCAEALASLLLKVTDKVFPIKKVKKEIPSPLWWDEECTSAIRKGN